MTAPRSDSAPVERILLVGFMGSGKTCVGRILAERLGWSFRDFDEVVMARLGLSIPEIFRQHGEPFFREMEDRVAKEFLLDRHVVLASGGGWPAVPGRMEVLAPNTFSVWLKVGPKDAVERARREGASRPLLAVPNPEERARVLLTEREPFYGKADMVIDTSGTQPEELAVRIEKLMHEKGRGLLRPLPPYK